MRASTTECGPISLSRPRRYTRRTHELSKLPEDGHMEKIAEQILDKPVAHIRHGHDGNADSLFIQFEDGTQLAIVLRPPARLKDARVMYFRDEGEVALALDDLLPPSHPN